MPIIKGLKLIKTIIPKNKQKEKRYGKIKPVVPLSPFKNSIKLESDKLSSDKSPA